MNLSTEQLEKLSKALPDWAVKEHPTKRGMSAIHPMAIIDRLNDVFGVAGWTFTTEYLSCEKGVQKVKDYKGLKEWGGDYKDREIYVAYVKGRLEVDDCVIEQYGGNTNDDAGDTLKGSATDALTKIASYLGIGAEIYKGHGNIDGGEEPQVDLSKTNGLTNRFKRD